RAAGPFGPPVTRPSVAVPVIDPAVESDRRAPVAVIKEITAAVVRPVTRGPVKADTRRQGPIARHPIIIEAIERPVTRRPEISSRGSVRLGVNRDRRRREADRDADVSQGGSRR